MKALILGLLMLGVIGPVSAMNHGGMVMDEKGMIMNANSDDLPRDCAALSETVDITIHAGQKHAQKFTGKMFAFDSQEWNVKPCAKINITFINDDPIRHQLMIHGLPGYLYPEGMFHLELYGEGQLQASLILPSQKKTYLIHCEVPQHMEKGMKAQLKAGGGDGDLSSIPGISAPVKADIYPVEWSSLNTAVLLLCVLAGCAIPFFILIYAQSIKDVLQKVLTKLNFKRKQDRF